MLSAFEWYPMSERTNGFVDRSNQQLSYYNTEFCSVRKQLSRIFDSLCEMYALINGHTLWCNSPKLTANLTRDAKSQSAFRFEVIRIWYAKFKMTNGRMGIIHYPTVKLRRKKRSLETTLLSPRKGHNMNMNNMCFLKPISKLLSATLLTDS